MQQLVKNFNIIFMSYAKICTFQQKNKRNLLFCLIKVFVFFFAVLTFANVHKTIFHYDPDNLHFTRKPDNFYTFTISHSLCNIYDLQLFAVLHECAYIYISMLLFQPATKNWTKIGQSTRKLQTKPFTKQKLHRFNLISYWSKIKNQLVELFSSFNRRKLLCFLMFSFLTLTIVYHHCKCFVCHLNPRNKNYRKVSK